MKRRQTSSSALPTCSRLDARSHFVMRPSDSPGWTPSVRESWAWSPHDLLLHDTDPQAHGLRGPEQRRCAEPGRTRGGHAEGLTRRPHERCRMSRVRGR
jgi:hypothetical protein